MSYIAHVQYDKSYITRKPSLGFPTRSDTIQAQMARGLKFQISKAAGLYYLHDLCSENKGEDCAADLGLSFCICKKQVFS